MSRPLAVRGRWRCARQHRRRTTPPRSTTNEAVHHRARDPRRERTHPEAELAGISKTSNEAVASLGVPYTWVKSYVAGDKVYCVHEAEDAETIREHARRGGFPADPVAEVADEFGPQTADDAAGRLTAPGLRRPAAQAGRLVSRRRLERQRAEHRRDPAQLGSRRAIRRGRACSRSR